MDELFGKVKEQASKAKDEAVKIGKKAYDKANTALSVGKLTFAIGETDSKIKEEYREIGKLVYEKYLADGNACNEDINSRCEVIDALFIEKMSLKTKKAELKESVACPECGDYNKKGAVFCSKCGAKLENDVKEDYSVDTEEAGDDSNEDYTSYFTTSPSKSDEIKEKVSDAAEKVKDAMEDVIPDIKEKAEDVVDAAADAAEKVKYAVKEKLDDDAPELKEKAAVVKDKIEERVKKVIKIKAKKNDD